MVAQSQALSRKELKSSQKHRSLMDQVAWWEQMKAAQAWPVHECEAQIKKLNKQCESIRRRAPSSTAYDDARSASGKDGGKWPPEADATPMVRARGERRIYPSNYITSSGHSYDVFVQRYRLVSAGKKKGNRIVTGDTQALTDDGYHGSVVSIGDLHKLDRRVIHNGADEVCRTKHKHREITNML